MLPFAAGLWGALVCDGVAESPALAPAASLVKRAVHVLAGVSGQSGAALDGAWEAPAAKPLVLPR